MASVLVAACGGGDGATPRVPRADPKPRAARAPSEPGAVADAIDPGEVPLLSSRLPKELREAHDAGPLGRVATAEEKLVIVRERRRRFMVGALLHKDVPIDDELLGSVLEIVSELEPLTEEKPLGRAGAEAALHLSFFYSLVNAAAVSSAGMPSVLLPSSTEAIARSGLTELFAAIVRDRDKLEARMLARALRGGDELVVAEALWDAAARLDRAEDGRGDPAREESMRRRGAQARAFDWITVAFVRLSNLDAEGGRAAISRAKALRNAPDARFGDATPAIVDHQLEALESRAKSLDSLRRTEGAKDADARLAHARALFDLARYEPAQAELEVLARDEATDARPLGLLARVKIAKDGANDANIRAAARLLEGAASRTKRDAAFYDADVGLRGQVLFWEIIGAIGAAPEAERLAVLEREGGKLRALTKEIAVSQPDRAETIETLLDLAKELANKSSGDTGAVLAGFADRAETLRKKYPAAAEPAELARALGILRQDRAAALGTLDFPWPRSPEPEALDLALLCDRVALAVQWGAPERLPTRVELADLVSRSPKDARALRVLDADSLAVRAQLSGDAAAWGEAATAYDGALRSAPDDSKPRVLASYATALAASGHEDVARKVLAATLAAVPEGSKKKVTGASLTLAALEVDRVPKEDSELAFASVASAEGDDSALGLQAKAWLTVLADRRGDKARARSLAKELLAASSPARSRLGGLGKSTGTGAVFLSSFQFLVHFTPTHESLYHLDMNVRLDPLFTRTAPLSEAQLRKLAGVTK